MGRFYGTYFLTALTFICHHTQPLAPKSLIHHIDT